MNLSEKVKELKKKVEEEYGVPASAQCLVFNGMKLEDDWSLDSYKITDGSLIYLF